MGGLMNFLTEAFSTPPYQIGAMVVIFGFCLIFLISKRFISAFIFLLLFLMIFFTWLSGPTGTGTIEKFQKRHSPTFHSADQ